MPLDVGSQVGHFTVAALIGEGSMGQVYRATDTQLGRDVALKILPDAFAADSDRLARFQREALVLASLNHPGIAAIYGIEQTGGTPALVLELVEGPTLADRLAQGPIPVDEALPIARQIGEALEAAHEAGIIHRDLKPANITVREDGTVKVLDLGLAKTAELGPEGDPNQSPTLTAAATQMGVIMGTAAYMSPEQARGKPVDKRADIWAFGCILYQMLTGQSPFAGDTVSETLAHVIDREPDWTALPRGVTSMQRRVLRRCLEKRPTSRLRDIGDALADLNDVSRPDDRAQAAPRRHVRWALTSAAAVLTLVGLVAAYVIQRPGIVPEVVRVPVPIGSTPLSWFALSPDGRHLAYTPFTPGDRPGPVWVRSLDTVEARLIPGTDGATYPFWSPDSRRIGFFERDAIKLVNPSGGPPQTVCELPWDWSDSGTPAMGATWNRDGVIVFGGAAGQGLWRVQAAGGTPTAITVLGDNETAHLWPQFLPDGRHFL